VLTAAQLLTAAQDLQYRLGYAEARDELAERAEGNLWAERDRLVEDLKRERQRAVQLERGKLEAQRNVYRLGREKLETQRVADRIAQERKETLAALGGKGFFRRLSGG
jgi:rubrerythrin